MTDYHPALEAAIEAARQAGRLLRDEFHRPGGPRGGDGHADVDAEAERLIRERLLAACPWDYRGEELGSQDNGGKPHLWLVDPNDGTVDYLRGWRGSAVSIAALREGVPVLGVVHAFAYPDDEGDLIAWAEGCGPITRNGQPLPPGPVEAKLDEKTVVFVSRGAERHPAANTACVAPGRFISLSSIAYRLARVAAGDGQMAVSLSSPGDWDYGAGHALLRAAGGVLVDERLRDVTYTPEGQSTTSWCFGGQPAVVRELGLRDWQKVSTPEPAPEPPFALVQPEAGRAVADAGRLARAQGCLLGQLAGDSLGGLVEFQSSGSIRARSPEGLRQLRDGGTWNLLAGQPTDDSELALMLARSLVHLGRFDPGAVLDAYVHWVESGPFDIGNATRSALVSKTPLAESQANGSLMRVSPLGIFGAGRPGDAASWARANSRMTHPNPVCQDACAVFVAAIATAVAGDGSAEACYQAALDEADRSGCPESVCQALADARDTLPASFSHQMGWVLIALQNAFYQLLHAPSLEEGVVDTVMRGGDTDTNGAIAGALLGAVHGRQGVPDQWVRSLLSCRPLPGTVTAHPRPVEFWPVDALELAEALLVAGQQGGESRQRGPSPGDTLTAG